MERQNMFQKTFWPNTESKVSKVNYGLSKTEEMRTKVAHLRLRCSPRTIESFCQIRWDLNWKTFVESKRKTKIFKDVDRNI